MKLLLAKEPQRLDDRLWRKGFVRFKYRAEAAARKAETESSLLSFLPLHQALRDVEAAAPLAAKSDLRAILAKHASPGIRGLIDGAPAETITIVSPGALSAIGAAMPKTVRDLERPDKAHRVVVAVEDFIANYRQNITARLMAYADFLKWELASLLDTLVERSNIHFVALEASPNRDGYCEMLDYALRMKHYTPTICHQELQCDELAGLIAAASVVITDNAPVAAAALGAAVPTIYLEHRFASLYPPLVKCKPVTFRPFSFSAVECQRVLAEIEGNRGAADRVERRRDVVEASKFAASKLARMNTPMLVMG